MTPINHNSALHALNQPTKQFDTENHIKLKEQTDNFEALIVKQMLDLTMNDEASLFPKATGSKIYQGMYNDELSKSLSGGFGYSELLFDHLTKK
jgi:peptidoglycan hydrolase FlgJ